jgi:hypothetical protein
MTQDPVTTEIIPDDKAAEAIQEIKAEIEGLGIRLTGVIFLFNNLGVPLLRATGLGMLRDFLERTLEILSEEVIDLRDEEL